MKAPDKIYCGNNGHGNLSYSTEKVYESMKEYIRKDALLDWAKKEHRIALTQEPSGISNGKMFLASRLIDFINPL